MKVQLDNKDMAEIIRKVRDDIGAYFAGVKAENETPKSPWGTVPGTYFHAIMEGVAEYYDEKAKEELEKGEENV
jgi:hypothetical protein